MKARENVCSALKWECPSTLAMHESEARPWQPGGGCKGQCSACISASTAQICGASLGVHTEVSFTNPLGLFWKLCWKLPGY